MHTEIENCLRVHLLSKFGVVGKSIRNNYHTGPKHFQKNAIKVKLAVFPYVAFWNSNTREINFLQTHKPSEHHSPYQLARGNSKIQTSRLTVNKDNRNLYRMIYSKYEPTFIHICNTVIFKENPGT